MTLVEFLRARLDEDEHVASGAIRGPWAVATNGEVYAPSYDREVRLSRGRTTTEHVYVTSDSEGISPSVQEEEAEHIARYNPARVLAEVAAKRVILDLHTLTVKKRDDVPSFDPITGERNEDQFDVRCALCDWVSWNPTSGCATLLVLAAPFCDHPDFDSSWEVA